MREYLEQLLVVLAIGSGIAILAKRVNAPYNVALVVVGLLLVLMDVLPRATQVATHGGVGFVNNMVF
jgi:CPA1 family monovalent cation:H+ antiporter